MPKIKDVQKDLKTWPEDLDDPAISDKGEAELFKEGQQKIRDGNICGKQCIS